MPQLNYNKDLVVGRVGQIYDQRPRKVYSKVSKSITPFGYYVVIDTSIPVAGSGNPSADGVKFPAQASDVTGNIGAGVVAETLSIESLPRVSYQGLVQELMSPNTPVSGNVQLTLNGQSTANIAYNASAATIQAAIVALSNVGTGNAVVTGTFNAGPVLVTFQGTLAGQPIALMTINPTNNTMLDASGNPVVPQINEQVPYADLPCYPAGHEMNVLATGPIYVIVEEDVTPTSTVYVRFASDPSLPQYGPGSFRASADVVGGSATAAALPNARYAGSAVAGALAPLELLTYG